MNNYSVCVYPYGSEFEPVLKHSILIDESYEINGLISPRGWGLSGKEITIKQKSGSKVLTVLSSFADIRVEFNTIIVPDFDISDQFTETVLRNIIEKVSTIRFLLWFPQLNLEQERRLNEACHNANCFLGYYSKQSWTDDTLFCMENQDTEELEECTVPTIAISGSWENTDKFEISLSLRDSFLNMGYRVSQIGSRNYCELLGFHSFPIFMLNPGLDVVKKVILFNRYIKRLIDIENPDLLIVTIPGAISSYDSKFTNGFGILPFLIFKAMTVDFHVSTVFYENITNEYIHLISDSCKYKFDSPVDCFHMTNMFINASESYERKEIVTEKVSRKMVDDLLMCNNEKPVIPVMNLCRLDSIDKLMGMVLCKLADESVKIML